MHPEVSTKQDNTNRNVCFELFAIKIVPAYHQVIKARPQLRTGLSVIVGRVVPNAPRRLEDKPPYQARLRAAAERKAREADEHQQTGGRLRNGTIPTGGGIRLGSVIIAEVLKRIGREGKCRRPAGSIGSNGF